MTSGDDFGDFGHQPLRELGREERDPKNKGNRRKSNKNHIISSNMLNFYFLIGMKTKPKKIKTNNLKLIKSYVNQRIDYNLFS